MTCRSTAGIEAGARGLQRTTFRVGLSEVSRGQGEVLFYAPEFAIAIDLTSIAI